MAELEAIKSKEKSRCGLTHCGCDTLLDIISVLTITLNCRHKNPYHGKTMIKVERITKYFGRRKVLDDVTFTVNDGEIVGFVGLNGAGKTTTIRVIVGVLEPNSGDVFINGISITKEKRNASKRVG
jgi:ABC-type multidrug transport system, ATPase component